MRPHKKSVTVMNYFCARLIGEKRQANARSIVKVLIILSLQHAASRIWTCAEPQLNCQVQNILIKWYQNRMVLKKKKILDIQKTWLFELLVSEPRNWNWNINFLELDIHKLEQCTQYIHLSNGKSVRNPDIVNRKDYQSPSLLASQILLKDTDQQIPYYS